MLTTASKPELQRDQPAEEALERLRDVVHLVLNAVRMRRRSKAFSSFTRTEKSRLLQDVKRNLHELVNVARVDDDQRRPSPLAVTASHLHHNLLSELHEDDFNATADSLLTDYIELREWFFKHPAFEKWQTGGSWYLHCYGEPRSGKVSCIALGGIEYPDIDCCSVGIRCGGSPLATGQVLRRLEDRRRVAFSWPRSRQAKIHFISCRSGSDTQATH